MVSVQCVTCEANQNPVLSQMTNKRAVCLDCLNVRYVSQFSQGSTVNVLQTVNSEKPCSYILLREKCNPKSKDLEIIDFIYLVKNNEIY